LSDVRSLLLGVTLRRLASVPASRGLYLVCDLVGVAAATVHADIRLCLSPHNRACANSTNAAATVGKREPAFEGTKGTQDIIRVVMWSSPLTRRVAVLQDSDPLVLHQDRVLVAVRDHGISRRVG